jgi:hypothetical protein
MAYFPEAADFTQATESLLLADCRIVVERESVWPSHPESYAGGSMSSW